METQPVLSKSRQVLESLRKAIREGALPPGSRMESIRDLSARFSVSTKTITSALEELSAENLIRREHGRGIFIRNRQEKSLHEIVLAGIHSNHIRGRYFDFLCRLAQPPNRRPDFNFTIRSLGTTADNRKNFELDLRKQIEYMNADCILISAPSLEKNEIRICMKLPVPVIFLGDFRAGLYPAQDFSQVTGDNVKTGSDAIHKLYSQTGANQIIAFSGSMEHYFNHYLMEGVMDAAKKIGIKIHHIEFPKGFGSRCEPEEQNRILRAHFARLLNASMMDFPILDLGVGELIDRGFSLIRHPGVVYSAEPSASGCFNFFQTINRQIDTLIENAADHKKFCIEMDTVLKKRRTGF